MDNLKYNLQNLWYNIKTDKKAQLTILGFIAFILILAIIIVLTTRSVMVGNGITEDDGPGDEINRDSIVFDGRDDITNFVGLKDSAAILTMVEDSILERDGLNQGEGNRYTATISDVRTLQKLSGEHSYSTDFSCNLSLGNSQFKIYFYDAPESSSSSKRLIITLIVGPKNTYVYSTSADRSAAATWASNYASNIKQVFQYDLYATEPSVKELK